MGRVSHCHQRGTTAVARRSGVEEEAGRPLASGVRIATPERKVALGVACTPRTSSNFQAWLEE
jgi:hypothetical protein